MRATEFLNYIKKKKKPSKIKSWRSEKHKEYLVFFHSYLKLQYKLRTFCNVFGQLYQ